MANHVMLNTGFACVLVPLCNFTKLSLTVDIKCTFLCQLLKIPQSKIAVLRLALILTIKGFHCNNTLLLYGVKFLTALNF